MRSLCERTTTRAGSSCEWEGASESATHPNITHQQCGRCLENPSLGGVARSTGVGSRIENPHQVVGDSPKTPPQVPPCQRGTPFSFPRRAANRASNNS